MRYGKRLLGVVFVCAVAGAGCTGGGGGRWSSDVASPAPRTGGGHFAAGVRGSVGISQGIEFEAQVGGSESGTAGAFFVTAGGDFDYEPWDEDTATEGDELDAALENRELTVGFRIFPMAEEGLVGGYVALSVSAVDIRFEVDGYGESAGQATGVAAAVGYRYPIKKTPLLAYAEIGVGLWDVPELDLVSGTGEVARYRERSTALKPVMPHLNFGLLCGW
ncbi:MAG: hypothetical protein ACYS9X_23060 [Planctomycetota bacterium]|jgi:hypothetical protein